MFDNDSDEKLAARLKASYRPVSASPKFKEQLLDRVISEGRTARSGQYPRFWFNPLFWAAATAAFLLFLLVYGVLTSSRPSLIAQPPGGSLPPEGSVPAGGDVVTPGGATSPDTKSPNSNPSGTNTSPAVSPSPNQPPLYVSAGLLEIKVTDAPPEKEVTAVNVTVTGVDIHKSGAAGDDDSNWISMNFTGDNTFDLLKVRGIEQSLADVVLPAGNYTQLRMEISEVEVSFIDNTTVMAVLPSGKLKLVHSFEISPEMKTALLFDFDAARSVNAEGNGNITFKPVINISTIGNKTEKPAAVEITSSALPDGEVGADYNETLQASGGAVPYNWTLANGSLPPGLTLDANGTISGVPEEPGDFPVRLRVEDSSPEKKSAAASFTISITGADLLKITTTSLSEGKAGSPYSAQLEATGGAGSFIWSITAGNIPAGLVLDPGGLLSGTPERKGNSNFTVQVTDSSDASKSDTQNFSLKIR